MFLDATGESLHNTRGRLRLDKTRHKFDVSLDDEVFTLCDQDDRITIVEVNEEPQYEVSALTRGKHDGSYLDHKGRKSLKITLSLHIKAWHPEEYMEIIDKILTWAHAGKLRLNYRQGQYLEGSFTTYPSRSPQEWTHPIQLEFTSLVFPYWQADEVVEVEGVSPATGAVFTIHPVGDAPYCFLEGRFTNQSNYVCNNFGISTITPADGLGESIESVFSFANLNHQAGEVFGIEYDKYGYLKLWRYTGNISAIKCRTGWSSDDLVLKPGKDNQVSIMSDQPYYYHVRARGAYM